MALSAGRQLIRETDEILAKEAAKLGKPLRWDPVEARHIAAEADAADAIAVLQRRPRAEVRGDRHASVLARLTDAIRLQHDAITKHLGELGLEEFTPVFSVQRRAARARWGEPRPRRGVG
jgi:hypothetical protein